MWKVLFEIERNRANTPEEVHAELEAQSDFINQLDGDLEPEEIEEMIKEGWIELADEKIIVWCDMC